MARPAVEQQHQCSNRFTPFTDRITTLSHSHDQADTQLSRHSGHLTDSITKKLINKQFSICILCLHVCFTLCSDRRLLLASFLPRDALCIYIAQYCYRKSYKLGYFETNYKSNQLRVFASRNSNIGNLVQNSGDDQQEIAYALSIGTKINDLGRPLSGHYLLNSTSQ